MSCNTTLEIPEDTWFDNTGIRKAILLMRYATFFREFIDLRVATEEEKMGIYLQMRSEFATFLGYFRSEAIEIGDESLSKEYDLMLKMTEEEDIAIPEILGEPLQFNASAEIGESFTVLPEIVQNTTNIPETPPIEIDDTRVEDQPSNDDAQKGTTDIICCICMIQQKNVLLLPCRHVCVCEACSVPLEICPLCRSDIVSKTVVYI
eukprot:TRINITY_DN1686_c0_g1_i1.p2 TRINITY_DN1686_c0_g1~~TRINITY_DN1686_c0_g1_i1.p2  ORF type:complete len:206 (+),score=55.42 TRINITY_DN1686_c0_g1_i1:1222-1839(+)